MVWAFRPHISHKGCARKTLPKCRNARSPHVIIVRPWEFSRLEQKRNDSQPIMRYALLVHESQEYFDRPKDVAFISAGMAYGEALRAAGVFVGGAGLQSPQAATTVSLRDGKRHVHDGPYTETKEFLAGFAIIDVPNLDAALEWAARHPAAGNSSVEVRPLFASDFAGGVRIPA